MKFFRIFLGLTLGLGSLAANPGFTLAAAGQSSGLQVTPLAGGLEVDWQVDLPNLQTRADGRLEASLEGCVLLDQTGQPVIPVCRHLVALPTGAEPDLQILSQEQADQPLPTGAWVAAFQASELQPDGSEAALPAQKYSGDFTPGPLSLSYLGRVAGQDLARLTFYPLEIHAGDLAVTRRVRARIEFHSPEERTLTSQQAQLQATSPILARLNAMVVNPGQVSAASQASTSPQPAAEAGPWAAIEVTQPGITAISYAALQAAGFPVDQVDPHKLQLTRAGVEIAVEWDGDDDTVFSASERILFYADPRFNRYTSSDVYFLSSSAQDGTRMVEQEAAPGSLPQGRVRERQVFEQNRIYTPDCNCAPIPAGRDGDRWVWDALRLPDRPQASYSFTLADVDAGQPARLTLWVIGFTDVPVSPDHNIQAKVNGRALGALVFDGKRAASAALDIPAGILQAGANTLELTQPQLSGVSIEGAWLDAFAIDYSRFGNPSGSQARFSGEETGNQRYSLSLESPTGLRLYDVTLSDGPRRLVGWGSAGGVLSLGDPSGSTASHTYAAASEAGLLQPARVRMITSLSAIAGADELVIAPAAFIPGLADLVSLRQSQGLSVAIQDVQAIYDHFDGRPTPDAIKDYLSSVYATGSPRPTYVLLVGDGTADPRRYRATSSATYIPPYLAEVDPLAGETAADNLYAAVDGDDHLPDFLIGRLPVNSPEELAAVVHKLVQYSQAPSTGSATQKAVFIADTSDGIDDFQAGADTWIRTSLDPSLVVERLYYDPDAKDDPAFRHAVASRWQLGGGLFVYNGHSSIHQWAVARFFHLDDVAGLHNAPRLPVLLEMTCLTGSFQVPDLPTLDESLVRSANGGAIAAWGPAGFSFTSAHGPLVTGFLQALRPAGGVTVGEAALQAKLTLASQSSHGLDALDTYTLLGDPATPLRMDIPGTVPIYLPAIQR